MGVSAAKRITTIVLDVETDRLLDIAAHERKTSRSEFVRVQLRRVLEQFRTHPKPRSAGIVKGPKRGRGTKRERGLESELFRYLER